MRRCARQPGKSKCQKHLCSPSVRLLSLAQMTQISSVLFKDGTLLPARLVCWYLTHISHCANGAVVDSVQSGAEQLRCRWTSRRAVADNRYRISLRWNSLKTQKFLRVLAAEWRMFDSVWPVRSASFIRNTSVAKTEQKPHRQCLCNRLCCSTTTGNHANTAPNKTHTVCADDASGEICYTGRKLAI